MHTTIVSKCQICGRKLIKGYFLTQKDPLKSKVIIVVCWRCKFLKRAKEKVSA